MAQIHKQYGFDSEQEKRYSPPQVIGVSKLQIAGRPKWGRISTSYVERQNLTMRMQMRRFTRLTNAFSKKFENLRAAVALHFFHYNFMRVHGTTGTTPGIKAGVTKYVWTWEDLLLLGTEQRAA